MRLKNINKTLAYALAALAIVLTFISSAAFAAPEIGKSAPEITATDIHGKEFKLSDHKGTPVVLEWTNHDCPFVMKHYGSGNMQATQKAAKDLGAYWVTIVSSAPGKQGHTSAEEAQEIINKNDAMPDVKILDESGEIGHAFDAQTTPHMFVIDKDGNLAYMGAIDDQPSPNPATVEGADNYVLDALTALKDGTEIKTAQTQPYGCGVKYGR